MPILLKLLLNILSLTMIFAISVFAWKNRDKTGCPQLLRMCAFLFLWNACAWMQSLPIFTGQEKMIWFRVMQIGPFYLVPTFLSYALHYTGTYRTVTKWFLFATYAVHTFGLFLVFTDPWLHGYWMPTIHWDIDRFGTLIMQTTALNDGITLFGLLVCSFSSILLMLYCIHSKNGMRGQARCILIAAIILGSYSGIRNILISMQNVLPPIAFLFSVPALIVLIGVIRFDFISLMPIAYQEVFEAIDEGVIIFSKDGCVLSFNRSARELFALHEGKVMQNNRKGLHQLQHLIETRYPSWRGDGSGDNHFDVRLTLHGKKYYYYIYIYPFRNNDQTVLGSIVLIRNVTKEHDQTEILQHQAERDGLTGLYNRQTCTKLAEEELAEENGPWSLLYLDLDRFKSVNDTYGHVFGDQVLRETCACISHDVGDTGILGRVGGEEFMVFLSNCTSDSAVELAEKIRAHVENHAFVNNKEQVRVTISIGVVTSSTLSFDTLYQYADEMLYQAKSDGRNCVRAWREESFKGMKE
ncbi:MAG: diguanylate cyclase [Ethanoligenens sp.]